MVEALCYREQGLSFEQIGARLKCHPGNAQKLVVKAMDRVIMEPAKRVLDTELRRLDILQASIFVDASEGDLAAQAMYLRRADHRAKLLGLYAREPHVNLNVGDGAGGDIKINFCLPPPREPVAAPPVDVVAHGPPDLTLKALPKPPQRERTPYGLWEKPDPWMK
jgi:hypothetical protein